MKIGTPCSQAVRTHCSMKRSLCVGSGPHFLTRVDLFSIISIPCPIICPLLKVIEMNFMNWSPDLKWKVRDLKVPPAPPYCEYTFSIFNHYHLALIGLFSFAVIMI